MSDAALKPPYSEATSGIVARLRSLRTKIATWFWVDGLVQVLWLALALVAVDLVLDWFFRMDKPQRGVMLAICVGILCWRAYQRLVRPLSATITDDALALQIEESHTELGQSLISALQFSRMDDAASRGMSPALVRHTVASGAKAAEGVPFGGILDGKEFRLNCVLLALATAAVAGLAYGVATNSTLAIWFNRNLLLGEATWPQKTYLVIERVGKDGAVTFPRGEDWKQVVTVRDDSRVVPDAVYLDFRRARGRSPLALKKSADRKFEATFAGVVEPFDFRARGGDAVTDWVRVELVEQPAVTAMTLVVTPPQYTAGKPEQLPAGAGPYYVLKGSTLEISGVANKPLKQAHLAIAEKRLPIELAGDLKFSALVTAADLVAGQYAIVLEDTLGLTNRRPTTFGLRTRLDREPRVRVKLVGVGGMVVAKARVPFTCRVTDDFGITTTSVAYRWKGDDMAQADGEGRLSLDQAESQSPYPAEASFDDVIELEPLKIPTGTGLSFRFESADNDDVSGPNIGKSSEFLLRIVTEEELRTDLLRREKEQRQEFERLVKNQEDLLTDSRALEAATKGQATLTPAQKDHLIQYHKRQKLVGQNTGAIAERMASIVVEVQNNRLEENGGRLQTRLTQEIIEPMRAVANELIPSALVGLEKARRQSAASADRDAALADSIAQQSAAVAQMKAILEHMVKSEGFQEAVNLLYEIQKEEQKVHEETNKARQERIKRILEGESSPPRP